MRRCSSPLLLHKDMLVEVLPEQPEEGVGQSGAGGEAFSIDTTEGKGRVGVLRVFGEGGGKSEGRILALDAHT